MQAMTGRATRSISLLALAAALGACTPALNWRQVSAGTSGVMWLMPCKPDQATRPVTLRVANQDVQISLLLQGCEASNMQFTFGQMVVPQGLTASDAMRAWRLASVAPLEAAPADVLVQTWAIQGARAQTPPERAQVVTGTHQVQWVWFADGNKIYQAAVYGTAKDKGLPEAAETYFSGIKLP
ncbi:hypothetical protein LINBF2_01500 [Limnohabitans sp. INBF002]|nr:hypothetical protein LINBF2_01500 [Limnohabitans sp. INBF002]